VATLRLFAGAREAAGTGRDTIDAPDLESLLREACARYGEAFAAVLSRSKVWVNGEPAAPAAGLSAGDEVAVLPPVSGG
jgi:molybdopterin converting factor small subunit